MVLVCSCWQEEENLTAWEFEAGVVLLHASLRYTRKKHSFEDSYNIMYLFYSSSPSQEQHASSCAGAVWASCLLAEQATTIVRSFTQHWWHPNPWRYSCNNYMAAYITNWEVSNCTRRLSDKQKAFNLYGFWKPFEKAFSPQFSCCDQISKWLDCAVPSSSFLWHPSLYLYKPASL